MCEKKLDVPARQIRTLVDLSYAQPTVYSINYFIRDLPVCSFRFQRPYDI